MQIKPATRQGPRRVLIPLTRGLSAFVDEADFAEINRHKWHADYVTKTWYAVRTERHRKIYTPSQNCANGGKKGFSSQYRGVGWDRIRERWRAQIKVMYRVYFLGRFDSEMEAAKAYDRAAKQQFGEFANTNFPV